MLWGKDFKSKYGVCFKVVLVLDNIFIYLRDCRFMLFLIRSYRVGWY